MRGDGGGGLPTVDEKQVTKGFYGMVRSLHLSRWYTGSMEILSFCFFLKQNN